MLLLSITKSLNVLTITNKAKVESRPPEIPITAFFKLVCSKRFASAEDCMLNISLHLSSLSCSLDGTKGCLSIYLSKLFIVYIKNLYFFSTSYNL